MRLYLTTAMCLCVTAALFRRNWLNRGYLRLIHDVHKVSKGCTFWRGRRDEVGWWLIFVVFSMVCGFGC